MFIKIFIFIIVVYYLTKGLVKMILPHIIKQQMDKFQSQFNQQAPGYQQKKNRKEGSVTVEKVPPKSNHPMGDDDYVDYEEIK
ncbi:MAG: DUF4834 family protein [Bacteroidota bacterium]|nr:DUF4834 family protein [Bacteroidota bacterium]